ncbi:MAG: L-serine ammonia-lyase, iron-sulfur-dependent, subunit alpha [Clostridia bacterium]|jgi:L-serine dehydratase|nr:L-serine ammonia-lyase, iron-sulfur-dependent, subunit alpha [Clostridia bacterium]MBR6110294.1 L-serine ammonia-lyase, iron-sulfur-dependent, subunit alpha [Clostridia bacterium]
MDYDFNNGIELIRLCDEEGIKISEAMIRREVQMGDSTREQIIAEMRTDLKVMRESVKKGLTEKVQSVSRLTGGEAMTLYRYADFGPLSGSETCHAAAAAMAVVEVNAAMGRIVAAPTAGASGILPAVLIECSHTHDWSDDQLIEGLFCAGAIGLLFAKNATISGAEGGCQAETGVASAMAAAALVEISGGEPLHCLDAAAIAIKNIEGLVCDPVAGLVECPCIKRNAMGAANALLSADMALCGITSLIPFDEVVASMYAVGREIRPEYRETAKGGLAATPTGKLIAASIKRMSGRRED